MLGLYLGVGASKELEVKVVFMIDLDLSFLVLNGFYHSQVCNGCDVSLILDLCILRCQ